MAYFCGVLLFSERLLKQLKFYFSTDWRVAHLFCWSNTRKCDRSTYLNNRNSLCYRSAKNYFYLLGNRLKNFFWLTSFVVLIVAHHRVSEFLIPALLLCLETSFWLSKYLFLFSNVTNVLFWSSTGPRLNSSEKLNLNSIISTKFLFWDKNYKEKFDLLF